MVGVGGIVSSLFVKALGSGLGTRFSVLGSGLWKTEKTKLKRDRVEAAPITTWNGGIRQESK
jgi:hypothetical protein